MQYTCETCDHSLVFETYKDMNLVLWVNYDEPDHAMCLSCWDSLSEKAKTKIYDKAYHKPQVYQQGMMSYWYSPHKRLELKLMQYLNEHPEAPWCYDCGELGIAHIYKTHNNWQIDWLKPTPLPDSLRGEKSQVPSMIFKVRLSNSTSYQTKHESENEIKELKKGDKNECEES